MNITIQSVNFKAGAHFEVCEPTLAISGAELFLGHTFAMNLKEYYW